MKLYFSPGACSLAVHILLRELEMRFTLEQVNIREHQVKTTGADYLLINPKGGVPAILLDDGQVLTEAAVILQYLADQKPEAGFMPRPGTFERYRAQEWLNYLATDLHRPFSPLFGKLMSDAHRESTRETLTKRFGLLSAQLERTPFLMGDQPTAPDLYLFVVTLWMPVAKLEVSTWPALAKWFAAMKARPAVKESRDVERAAKERV